MENPTCPMMDLGTKESSIELSIGCKKVMGLINDDNSLDNLV